MQILKKLILESYNLMSDLCVPVVQIHSQLLGRSAAEPESAALDQPGPNPCWLVADEPC